jgi:aspartate carbamoyltransferase catalytic subunit
MRHLLSISDLSIDEMMSLTNPVNNTQSPHEKLRGTLAFLFAQPSLRTMSSFAAAGTRIGLAPIQVTATGDALKDNTDFHDEIVQLSLTSTCVVVRASKALERNVLINCKAPIVNAGDGRNEHPTQTMNDITVMREVGLERATVALIGNLKYQRTTHSLAVALHRLGVRMRLISPAELRMPDQYVHEDMEIFHTEKRSEVDDLVHDSDIIYMPPLGYWGAADVDYSPAYGFDLDRAQKILKPTARLMHPFPRFAELDKSLDGSSFDAYRLQTMVGPVIRERILRLLLGW